MKVFNTTAVCIPSENYMVDISDKIRQIAELIEQKKYFTINRARQYGKTTTLMLLGLSTGYILSFHFNREKKQGVHLVHVGDKLLYEGVI